ncbi:MAG: transcription antitermination factor NusB [Nitrospirae bacterium]|nr:MAG: transcription antitermination factor NusB [Nitrospirota bacterium]
MSLRRKSRELAVQVLYQWDVHGDTSGWMDDFWEQNKVHPEVRAFADQLVHGVIDHAEELDRVLAHSAENWSVSRMAITDRTVLRVAVYELLYLPDIPGRVTLNEAIEVVKLFGDEQSGAFVNGILDRILREDPRLQAKAREAMPSVAHD